MAQKNLMSLVSFEYASQIILSHSNHHAIFIEWPQKANYHLDLYEVQLYLPSYRFRLLEKFIKMTIPFPLVSAFETASWSIVSWNFSKSGPFQLNQCFQIYFKVLDFVISILRWFLCFTLTLFMNQILSPNHFTLQEGHIFPQNSCLVNLELDRACRFLQLCILVPQGSLKEFATQKKWNPSLCNFLLA